MPPPFTVIIPAHNEEAVIERCLRTALCEAPAGHGTQIIVAANGCDDRTASIAREFPANIDVVEIAEGSKTKAMNAASAVAKYFPRIYLDADIQCDFRSLSAVAHALRKPGIMAASPALRLDLTRSNFLVRAYYRVWTTQPYVTQSMVGSGCYGLSEAGSRRIGAFPDLVGDDIWVHSTFPKNARENVSQTKNGEPVFFVVSPPRRAWDQIRVETRRRLGNAELRARFPELNYTGSNSWTDLKAARRSGASVADILAYLGMKITARVRVGLLRRNGRAIEWERDELARRA
ncbi:glycosyltransferase [Aurantiacibacter aquimixticola]|uniref:Glycosyltransferase n=1 Tax=Aurantiacibacter aquimixticola TaxID=1958945 RepID=A0A419RUJ7_9SPHN|nr:glycosyltransferase [Aurantiacibacter aquimixticola]RJY09461.1 glycosyltransferase [Aurantiacibacter aquimixticola]